MLDSPGGILDAIPWVLLFLVVAVAVASAAQVLTGLGFALIASPLLIAALGHLDGVRSSVALSLVLNVLVLTRSHRSVRWGDALRLLLPAAVLVLPALALTTRLGGDLLSALAGAVVLLGVALVGSGWRARWVQGPAGPVVAGASSGVLSVLAGVSGPPVALFVAHRRWPPPVAAATLQAYALPLNVLTLIALGLPDVERTGLAAAAVGLVVGATAAWPFIDRVPLRTATAVTLTTAAGGGLFLVVRGIVSAAA